MASEVYETPEGTVTSDPVEAAEMWAAEARRLCGRIDHVEEQLAARDRALGRRNKSIDRLTRKWRDAQRGLGTMQLRTRAEKAEADLARVTAERDALQCRLLGEQCAQDETDGAPIAGRSLAARHFIDYVKAWHDACVEVEYGDGEGAGGV